MKAYHVLIIITSEKLQDANILAKQIGYDKDEHKTFTKSNGCNASGLDTDQITHYFTQLPVRGEVLEKLKATAESNPDDYKVVVKKDGTEFTEQEALDTLVNVKPIAPASFYAQPPEEQE